MLAFIIPIVSLLIGVILWYLFGRDEPVIETVEFYPPAGISSIDAGLWYHGKIKDDAVLSMLIYLANKGYIQISDKVENNSIFKVDKFKIIKLREYDGNVEEERIFMEGLFTKKASLFNSESKLSIVHESDLTNSFYTTIDKIKSLKNKHSVRKEIFVTNFELKHFIVWILIVISTLTTIMIPSLAYGSFQTAIISVGQAVFYIPFIYTALTGKMPLTSRIFICGFALVHAFLFLNGMPISEAIKNETIYKFSTLLGLGSVIGLFIVNHYLPQRTPKGNEMLGKLRGFRNFLMTAEKSKLEMLVAQNPSYFYNILPYTYALDVSKEWIETFETIALRQPNWYDSTTSFSTLTFTGFMNSTMKSANRAMSSRPSSSGGGSSGGGSGGGSSGGGSGGGGGGSW